MSSGIYSLPAGAKDLQNPHDEDEVYYVLEGNAKFKVAEEIVDVEPGDVLYVPARVEHELRQVGEPAIDRGANLTGAKARGS